MLSKLDSIFRPNVIVEDDKQARVNVSPIMIKLCFAFILFTILLPVKCSEHLNKYFTQKVVTRRYLVIGSVTMSHTRK